MKLVETFPSVWASPDDVKTIYIDHRIDKLQNLKTIKYKFQAKIKLENGDTFLGKEFDTHEEAVQSVEPIIQRLNAYRD